MYLQKLYEWYYESDYSDAITSRNALRLEIVTDQHGQYEVKFLKIMFYSHHKFLGTQSQADTEEENLNEWIEYTANKCVDDLLYNANNGICFPMYSSLRSAWSEGYNAFFQSSMSSVLVTLPIVLIILILVLNNWILGVMCTLNVLLIMTNILGFVYILGWKFGLVQSIAVILVIGFSVDYCVHIAHGYTSAPRKDSRKHRCQYALLTNGHAIMSSAVVSIFATTPIIFNKVKIFEQIGIITSLTIASSLIFTFTIFVLMLPTCAPQGDQGKLWK